MLRDVQQYTDARYKSVLPVPDGVQCALPEDFRGCVQSLQTDPVFVIRYNVGDYDDENIIDAKYVVHGGCEHVE